MRTQCLLECYYGERLSRRLPPQQLERSFESEESIYFHSRIADDLLQMIENPGRNDQLELRQIQNIRALGANLKRAADSMQINPSCHLRTVEQAILQEEGLSELEMQVVRTIFSVRTSTTISRIAGHLKMCLTSRTFRAALQYLCYSASDVPEELAAACELARLIYPRFQDAIHAGPVYDELRKFIENKLDEVLY